MKATAQCFRSGSQPSPALHPLAQQVRPAVVHSGVPPGACVWSRTARGRAATNAVWPRTADAQNAQGECRSPGQEGAPVFPWSATGSGFVGTRRLLKRTSQLPKPSCGLRGPTSHPALLSPDWTAGPFRPQPPPGPRQLPLCTCPPCPAPTWPSGRGAGGTDVNPLGRATLWSPGARSCSLLAEQTASWSPVQQTRCLIPARPLSSQVLPVTFASPAPCVPFRRTVWLQAAPADFRNGFV